MVLLTNAAASKQVICVPAVVYRRRGVQQHSVYVVDVQVVAEVDLHTEHYNSPISTVQAPEQVRQRLMCSLASNGKSDRLW